MAFTQQLKTTGQFLWTKDTGSVYPLSKWSFDIRGGSFKERFRKKAELNRALAVRSTQVAKSISSELNLDE